MREGEKKEGTKEGNGFMGCVFGGRKCINIILFDPYNNFMR